METAKPKMTFKWFMVILCLALGMSATLNTGWLFNSYYQLCSDALNLNDAQMGILNSIIGGCGIIGYVIGGIVLDKLRPKACIVIGSLGMALFSVWAMMLPDFTSIVIINTGLVVFGIVFYWTACVRYASIFGPKELSGKASGLLFSLSGGIMLIYGNVVSALIASMDAVSGFRMLVGSSAAILIITAAAQMIYDKEPWFGRGMDVKAESTFNIRMLGTVLSNKRMWVVWVVAAISSASSIAISYMQPLLADYYGASTAVITLISAWANNGTSFVLAFVTGILVDKFGSASKVLIIAFVCMMAGTALLLVTPWSASFLPVVIICMILVRSVNAIGKPGRVAMVAEVDIPEAAKGTATGVMFAATSIPSTFLFSIFGNMLNASGNSRQGYMTIYFTFVVIAVIGIAAVNIFIRMSNKVKKAA